MPEDVEDVAWGNRKNEPDSGDHVGFVAIVCLTGVLQGLLLLVGLRRIRSRNRTPNGVLSVFVGLIILTLLARLIRDEGAAVLAFYPQVLLLMDTPVYSYGPLLFLYLYSLTNPTGRLHRWWGLHFVPVALHLLRQMEYYLEPASAFIARLQTGHFPFARYIMLGAAIQMSLYIVACLYLVFVRRPTAGGDGRDLRGYVGTVLALVTAGWGAWAYFAVSWFTPLFPRIGYAVVDLAWVVMSLLPILLAYFAIGRQEIFRSIPRFRKYEGSLLSAEEVATLQFRLEQLMAAEKPYLKPGLTLADLSDKIGCAPRELSRVINERFEQNFFDYVNGYRIQEFKRIAGHDRYRNQTVLAIAYDVGFNSKTAFYAAFRKLSDESPGDYLRPSAPTDGVATHSM